MREAAQTGGFGLEGAIEVLMGRKVLADMTPEARAAALRKGK